MEHIMSKEWPPEMLALPPRKCKKCGTVKPITDFPRNRTSPGGVFETCMVCYKASRGSRSNGKDSGPKTEGMIRVERGSETPTRRYEKPVFEVLTEIDGVEITRLRKLSGLPGFGSTFKEVRTSELRATITAYKHNGLKLVKAFAYKQSMGVMYYLYFEQEKPTAVAEPKKRSKR
jgi:hypothetical protein